MTVRACDAVGDGEQETPELTGLVGFRTPAPDPVLVSPVISAPESS
jgi:hypothetical protein